MNTLIAGLKWLSVFLERRFPPKFVPADFILRNEYKAATEVYAELLKTNTIEIEKLKEQVQTLSIRVGLSRPIQTVVGRMK